MRISTNQIFNSGVDAIQDQQAKVSKTSLQMATGKRILAPSDDPTGAVQSLELGTTIATTQQYQKNAVLAEQRLNLEESIFESLSVSVQRVRELTIQGNNDTQTEEDRRFIAAEIWERLDELLGLANTRDANGEYIFAGYQSQTQPFAPNGVGGFDYFGDNGQRFLQISADRQIAIGDSGDSVFRQIPNGNGTFATQDNLANSGTGVIDPGAVIDPSAWIPDTYTLNFTAPDQYEIRDGGGGLVQIGTYTSGASISFNGIQTNISGVVQTGDSFTISPSVSQDIFTTYQNLITALEGPSYTDVDRARFHNAINRVLVDLDQAAENVLDTRTTIGARLNVLETQNDTNEGSVLSLQEVLSEIQDLDYAEAVSRLQLQLAGLQAAQQTYIKTQRLSLFDYLS